MTQNEKELLMKDLCERLPFKVEEQTHDESAIETVDIDGFFVDFKSHSDRSRMYQMTLVSNDINLIIY